MHKHPHHNFRLSKYIVFILLMLFAFTAFANPAGKEVFEQRCQRCHDLPDPGKAPEMGWEKRLKLMAKLAKLSPDQKTDVLGYLQSHSKSAEKTISLADERRLFEQKCSLCHTVDRVFLEPMTDETRQHIVKRMREKNQQWISDEESRQILDYLSKAPKVTREKKAQGDAEKIFLERCSACHTLERVYSKMKNNETSWLHVVQRMQKKAPEWLSKEDAGLVVEYLRTLR
jgi:mono/diheme cytochrome c family protein